jgi:NAD(P)-dependent dehydrogenase (short-subunit alcohol dehydrogenase family)
MITTKKGIVFGATGGLGTSLVNELEAANYRVFSVVHEIVNDSHVACDISDYHSVANVFSLFAKMFGDLDFVVNCAGITKSDSVFDMSEIDWEKVINVNLNGSFYICKCAATYFKKHKKGGSIVLIGSPYGQRFVPGLAHYCVSKAGVSALAKAMSVELGEIGVRVNNVMPGLFLTKMTEPFIKNEKYLSQLMKHIPDGKLGSSSDLARIIVNILSDEYKHMNGCDIIIDGGYLNLLEGGIIK